MMNPGCVLPLLVAALGVLSSTTNLDGQEPGAKRSKEANSEAENKRIIRRYFEEWANRGDTAAADQLIATNLVLRNPPAVVNGLETYKQSMAAFHKAFPDLQFTLGEMIAEGDRVAAPWTFRGTHQGELQGRPATGKTVTISGISVFRIARGKIQEITASMDRLGMQQQLGWLPASPQPAK